ncbi:MAG TPA: phage portal protein [Rhodothermia bacterium]
MWPFSRKKKQGSRIYKGALVGRTTADWIVMNTSADAEIRTSLPKLRDRSRQLVRDNDYVQSAQRNVRTNVVGQGVGFQSQVRMRRGKDSYGKGKLNKEMNDQIEGAWYRWQRKENCHTAGMLCFDDIERLVMDSNFESGEVLVRFVTQRMGSSKVPLALEIIESDMLDDGLNDIAANGNAIRMGVEVNSWGRPVAYWFHARHPGDYPMVQTNTADRARARKRVPADEILHLFITKRPNQTRGVPWLHSTILRLHHMGGYEEAEVIAARATACQMGFIQSPEGDAPGDMVENGQRVTESEPGVWKYLAPGETANMITPSRPGGQFDPFIRLMLRGVAAGVGGSYESISRDYSQSNYSSSRLALIDDRELWKILQGWLIKNFHQVVYERWMDLAVLSGELVIPDYETNRENYIYPRWMPRGWAWVDPAKEVAASIAAVRAGFTTVSEVVAQAGGDYEELLVQRQHELELAKEYGVVFDTDPAAVDGTGAAQALAEAGKDPPPPPKK